MSTQNSGGQPMVSRLVSILRSFNNVCIACNYYIKTLRQHNNIYLAKLLGTLLCNYLKIKLLEPSTHYNAFVNKFKINPSTTKV